MLLGYILLIETNNKTDMEMTNTINTLENLNKLANKMVKVWGMDRKDAENLAEWNLRSKCHKNNFSKLMKAVN